MSNTGEEGLLTLEPLMDAIREALEETGWELSGLQKTTSHQFEGRWEGESTRSAYLFFHLPDGSEEVSMDVYLDETSRGLTGNLALVVGLVPLGEVDSVQSALTALSAVSATRITPEYRRPLTLRFRVSDVTQDCALAETEVRFKVRIPRRAIRTGAEAITDFVTDVVDSFAHILESGDVRRLLVDAGDGLHG